MKDQNTAAKTNRSFKMPHAYVIIVLLLAVVSLLTYFIPAGSYARYEDETGRSVVDPGAFAYSEESNPVSILQIPSMIVKAIEKNASLIFSIIIIAGALEIILSTGMFHAFCNKLSRACAKSGKEILFIPAITLIFTLIGLTQSTDKFIAFGPIGVMLAVTLGYDAIVGIAIVLLGVGVGFSVGALHTTTAVAQQISGLDLYSGIGVRVVVTIIFYLITTLYICQYAKRIKDDPAKSYLHNVEGVMDFDPAETEIAINWRHFLVLGIFAAGLGVLMWGCLKKGWSFQETSILFLWVGILSGLVYGIGPSQMCKTFIKGCGGATGSALVVGFGAAVSLVLNEAGVIDTVVMGLAQMLNAVPGALRGTAMFAANIIINFFIPSGNGQAAVVMPIMAPLSDVIGVSRQTAVMAFKLGDGLCNYVLPHAAALMGFLGVTGVPYDKWMKFMLKLFAIWFAAGCVVCAVCQIIGYV